MASDEGAMLGWHIEDPLMPDLFRHYSVQLLPVCFAAVSYLLAPFISCARAMCRPSFTGYGIIWLKCDQHSIRVYCCGPVVFEPLLVAGV